MQYLRSTKNLTWDCDRSDVSTGSVGLLIARMVRTACSVAMHVACAPE